VLGKSLPLTGSDSETIVVEGVGLLLLGGFLVVAARRRRAAVRKL